MGRTYEAMLRAERERRGSAGLLRRRAEPEKLGDWEADGGGAAVSAEVDWGTFVFDQIGSIDQRLDAFDETLRKGIPEFEGRFMHLLELRLQSVEREVAGRLAGLGRQLVGERSTGQRLQLGLLGLNLVLLGLLAWRIF